MGQQVMNGYGAFNFDRRIRRRFAILFSITFPILSSRSDERPTSFGFGSEVDVGWLQERRLKNNASASKNDNLLVDFFINVPPFY
jgi:hypothetical protein